MTVFGIDIDSKLNFSSHVSRMCIKAGRQLNVWQRIKGSLDYASRLSIILLCPFLTIVVWCGCLHLNPHCQNLRLLKKALRFVVDDYASDHYDLLKKADVAGEKIMALIFLAIEVYKCIIGFNPNTRRTYLPSKVQIRFAR